MRHHTAAIGEMRRDVLVIAVVAGLAYANDPAPVSFDAGDWYVVYYLLCLLLVPASAAYNAFHLVTDLKLIGLGSMVTGQPSKSC